MEYCDECGSAMVPNESVWECMKCGSTREREVSSGLEEASEDEPSESSGENLTQLGRLDTTDTGSVKKVDAMQWLENLDEPTRKEFKDAIVEKPDGFSGSTFPTDISTIRVTGNANFIETVAGLFKPILDMEDYRTYVEINLQKVEEKDSGELTDNYALYLSVAERSG